MLFLNIYTLDTAEQLNLFFTEDGNLLLEKFKGIMSLKTATYDTNGIITGEGFINTSTENIEGINFINSYCASQGSLGYFNETKFTNGNIESTRRKHQYFIKSSIMITENSHLIMKFGTSSEEDAKGSVKTLVESLNFKTSTFRIDDKLIRTIKKEYKWTAAKLERIEKNGDSTKKVSYEIDPANDTSISTVDELYQSHGKMSHIQFEFPYEAQNCPKYVTVKLYKDGNRIVIDENQFPLIGRDAYLKPFIIQLLTTLIKLKKEGIYDAIQTT
ncbi:hypothetical protein [Bacillus toyonensis]|uniref:hypothetical protein n=1 Tax=Bacillus toyonensis TaxID=155322 RepID=UPI000BF27BA1|nr:hypothetical protein [Bacillus toyonensis]PGB48652.1 hypothetical protein COM02_01430 [Bacillus toyonensis]